MLICFGPRRFYLAGDITNLYPFIQGSLEWPFSEIFSANISLRSQYKYIAFNRDGCVNFLLIDISKMSVRENYVVF